MPKKYEEKFFVLNLKHVEELEPGAKALVKDLLRVLSRQIKTDNKYYVCNQDEPYSQHVIDIILGKLDVDEVKWQLDILKKEVSSLRITNTDELQAQEIQSLREQVKIACRIVKFYEPDMSISGFLHDLGTCDFQTYIEDEIDNLKKENGALLASVGAIEKENECLRSILQSSITHVKIEKETNNE